MDIARFIQHPELMDRESLYDLRGFVALYPCHQTARILLLQNLYLLHDPSFDEELQRSSIYITDRKTIFNIIEAPHYQLKSTHLTNNNNESGVHKDGNRTVTLIDSFLESIPKDNDKPVEKRRKPTPADAAVDYVAYLLETDEAVDESPKGNNAQMKGQKLIDDFISNESNWVQPKERKAAVEIAENEERDGEQPEDSIKKTESRLREAIKQGQYGDAIEIIKWLNLNYPEKNRYFADQIRFLEKLMINNKTNK